MLVDASAHFPVHENGHTSTIPLGSVRALGRPAISGCPWPRIVHVLPSQEDARTHLACGLRGAGGYLAVERHRNRGGLLVLVQQCLLLVPCPALVPRGMPWVVTVGPITKAVLASHALRMQPTTFSARGGATEGLRRRR